MAVIAMWKCDRDGAMFDDKKAADAHDKMLELGEVFTRLLEQVIPEVDGNKAEEFGLLMARHKEQVILACKGKIDALDEVLNTPNNVATLETAEHR
ncbi:MAG: YebG family protein [Chromatiales bacterium]|nr:YebG family protein [Gammaproteobacteria bacterium]MBW6477268.1 YebG family protein [Chromatiales bacterium]